MTTKAENRIIILGALIIAVFTNTNLILNFIRPNNNIITGSWEFSLYELIFQVLILFMMCALIGISNMRYYIKHGSFGLGRPSMGSLYNLIIFTASYFIGSFLQRELFDNAPDVEFYFSAYLFRFLISVSIIGFLLKILTIYRSQREKELENERLKSEFYKATLTNLKAQINPHFLFNSLTNLSALINETPDKAQSYLSHLSKVFRYSLSKESDQLVSLQSELTLLESSIQLYKLRLGEGLEVAINTKDVIGKQLLHMSLQPLMENAIKHNLASPEKPLKVEVVQEGDTLLFKNNLQDTPFKQPSTGIGLANLNERYKLLTKKEIELTKTDRHFIVTLPLIQSV
jgi:two-component system LytT family sensor kinase